MADPLRRWHPAAALATEKLIGADTRDGGLVLDGSRRLLDLDLGKGVGDASVANVGELRGKPPDVPQQGRARAKPILDAFHVWLLDTRRQLSQKSGLANTIGCALNHWQALIR